METIRLIISLVFLCIATLVVIGNACCVYVSFRNRKREIDRHHSTVPLVSAILAGLGYSLYPYSQAAWFWLLPFFDMGNWILFFAVPTLLRENIISGNMPEDDSPHSGGTP